MTNEIKQIVEKRVVSYGHEWILVETDRDNYPANAMGHTGFVIKSVRKLKKGEEVLTAYENPPNSKEIG